MSETQSRENFSKYDAMTTQQLRELLRQDSREPTSSATAPEEILYIMEALAAREKDSFPEERAMGSWKAFQQDYLDAQDEEAEPGVTPAPSRKRTWMRRWAAAAAAVVILISIPLAAVALNPKKIENTKLVWKDGSFYFQPEAPAIATKDNGALLQALSDHGVDPSIVPSRILERYDLKEVAIYEGPEKEIYMAIYTDREGGKGNFLIGVETFLPADPSYHQANEGILEVYEADGIEYYIVRNNKRLKALWLTGPYECFIAGEMTLEELKAMIDSIGN